VATAIPPQEDTPMSIRTLERDLARAERRANAPMLSDEERARRWDEVAAIAADLADERAAVAELADRRVLRW
jgi:hypothetical protein